MKIKESDLQLSGDSVHQKIYTGSECGGEKHYNWERIGKFYFKKGNPSPNDMAKLFYNAIKGA